MQPPPPPGAVPTPAAPAAAPRALGLILSVPAALACLGGYAWPTVRTLWNSLHRGGVIRDREWVGLDNYQLLASSDHALGIGFALSLAILPLLVLLLVAPLLAWAAQRAGRPVRLITRAALAVPMVCLAPVAAAAAFLVASRPDRAGQPSRFADVDAVQGELRLVVLLTLFGLVCGLGVTFYLAVLRGSPARSPWPGLVTVGGVGVMAALAVALQTFTYPYVITGGGPVRASITPMLAAYQQGIQRLDLGVGSAQAVLLLVPLLLLGLGAVLLVALSGLRVEVAPQPEQSGRSPGMAVAAVLGLVVVLAVALVGLWPWLVRLGNLGSGLYPMADLVGPMLHTWLPPLVSVVVGVGLAAVAGFGIGGLRPLGRWSELLLLPFAPWLFVGVGPLGLTKVESAIAGDRVNSLLGLIPPVWLVVPALVLFTVLFRGLAAQRLPYGRMMLWGLPMAGLLGGATWLVQSQSLFWPLLVATTPDTWPAPLFLIRTMNQYATQPDVFPVGVPLPAPMILVFAGALVVLQLFYLDRLAIRVGHDDRPHGQATS